jgi:acetyl-CoA C-acetyltransferase
MAVVILSSARTPIGAFQGGLASLRAAQLGGAAVAGAIERAGVTRAAIELVILGNVITAATGQAPARQAARLARLPDAVPAVTVNKMCGSGLEALIQGARAILAGDATRVVVGGMESMSNAPYALLGARAGLRLGHAQTLDTVLVDGLVDAYDGRHMGSCAERCAVEYRLDRQAQDAYAVQSYQRAQTAARDGSFAAEIVAKGLPLAEDEGPWLVDFQKLPTLRPAFEADGTITAANASTINDGAAALVLADERVAREAGHPVAARVVGWSVHAQAPADFGTAPIDAIRALFARTGWAPDEVDAYEINEAFAAVPLAAMSALALPSDRVNVFGGAVALGHPIGASGARIVVTLLNVLSRLGGRRGVASICIGGGEALALAIEVP